MQERQKRPTKKSIKKSFLNSKKKHLIITGKKGSGKSTLLQDLLKDFDAQGIISYAQKEVGVFLKKEDEVVQIGYYDQYSSHNDQRMLPLDEGFIKAQSFIDELLGVENEFIYLDEIGYLENNQIEYQNKLVELFDKKRVIAVVRKQDFAFINSLKSRDDVYVVDIDLPIKKIGLVIMASGFSKRFTENKLLFKVNDKTLLETIIEKTDGYFENRIVVTRYKEVKNICDQLNCDVLLHDYPDKNDTIRLGLSELKEKVDSCMFITCDQPELLEDTIWGMLNYCCYNSSNIVRLSYKEIEGNPVVFPKEYFDDLLNLPKGKGGNIIIKNNPNKVLHYEAFSELELLDIDSKEDIELIQKRKEVHE